MKSAARGRFVMWFLAIPFSAVGIGMLYSISTTLLEASAMGGWPAVPATLLEGGVRTQRDDDSTTYKAFAKYRYDFDGATYVADRVAIAGGADNIGSFQTDLGQRLRRALNSGATIQVFVNPENPAEAIIDRSIRWGLVLFKGLFVVLFGGIGVALVVFMLRAPKASESVAADPVAPWTANPVWRADGIFSNARLGARFAIGFALLWNLVTLPLCFLLYTEVVEKRNLPALLGLLFPLAGIWLIIWATRQWRDWRRYQFAPLILDPFPGAIGGEVGGRIKLNTPFDQHQEYWITLTQLRRYRGSDNKSEVKADWQERMLAYSEAGQQGTDIQFLFQVPADLPDSSTPGSEFPTFEWRINLSADLAQGSIDRDYDIPCFESDAKARTLSDFNFVAAERRQEAIDQAQISSLASFRYDHEGQQIFFPAGRNLGLGALLAFMGVVFGGAGVFLFIHEQAHIFGSIFIAVGVLFLISVVYSIGNSLRVRRDGRLILTTRKVLGVPIKRREISLDSIRSLALASNFQSSSGGKHRIFYHVNALGHGDEKICLGEGFDGRRQGLAAIDMLADTLALPSRLRRVDPNSESGYQPYRTELE